MYLVATAQFTHTVNYEKYLMKRASGALTDDILLLVMVTKRAEDYRIRASLIGTHINDDPTHIFSIAR